MTTFPSSIAQLYSYICPPTLNGMGETIEKPEQQEIKPKRKLIIRRIDGFFVPAKSNLV